jgi:alcohol dehydrogenase
MDGKKDNLYKSRIAVFDEANEEMVLKEEEVPALKEGQILVKNSFTTLCRSDINTFLGKRQEKTPTILGHEITGTIEEFGPEHVRNDERGNRLEIGDRITWAIFASDPESDMAKKGIPQKGRDLFKYGHEEITNESSFHGGLADYIILRQHTAVIKIGDAVPDPVAAIINCAVATVAGSLRLAGDIRRKVVAVSGLGMLGTIACAMAGKSGAFEVIGIDIDPDRLEKVKKYGVVETIDARGSLEAELTRIYRTKRPIDVVLEFSGAATAMETTLKALSIGGTAVWVGATFPQRDLNIDPEYMIRNILTIKGLHNYNRCDFVRAVEFMEEYHDSIPFKTMVQTFESLESVNDAFDYAKTRNDYRVGIKI